MVTKLVKVDTRNGPAWILPEYNVPYYVSQLAQLLWANRFNQGNRKKGK